MQVGGGLLSLHVLRKYVRKGFIGKWLCWEHGGWEGEAKVEM